MNDTGWRQGLLILVMACSISAVLGVVVGRCTAPPILAADAVIAPSRWVDGEPLDAGTAVLSSAPRHSGAVVQRLGRPPVERGTGVRLPVAPPYTAAAPRAVLRGLATWYDDGPGLYAAAGPVLRRALGSGWRGQTVTVVSAAGDRAVRVRLTDWCACGARHGVPTLLDLSREAFDNLSSPTRGVIRVTITVAGIPAPPATDR